MNLSKSLLHSVFGAAAVLGILIYIRVNSGSCAPAQRKLPSLATVFGQVHGVGVHDTLYD